MSTPNASGAPRCPKEWWEEVSLDALASCTRVVKSFMNAPETADVSQLPMALPLFILCGGNHSSFADTINWWTDRIKEHAKRDIDSSQAEARINNWYARLGVVNVALSRIPKSYSDDISILHKCVESHETDRRQSILAIKQKTGFKLKHSPKDIK